MRAVSPREELAWAAGLWDGEGSCGVYERKDGRMRAGSQWSLRVSVGQHHDPEVLHRFRAIVGVGKVYGPYSHPSGDRYVFQVVGKNAIAVLDKIWPWLSGPKRCQAQAALEKWNSRELQKGGHVCAPDCTCGRQKWKTETDIDPKLARRRAQQREAQRRHRERLKQGVRSEA